MFARRVSILFIPLALVIFGISACQTFAPAATPTDLPTLPPPTGLAALASNTATATPSSTTTPTATGAPSKTLAPTATPSSTAVSVTGTITATGGTPCFGSISGRVIEDLNANHQIDPDEPGVLGAVLYLKNANGLVAMYTIGNGQYSFPGLVAGAYNLTEIAPAGFTTTDTNSIDLNVICGTTITQDLLNLSILAGSPTATPTAAASLPGSDTGSRPGSTALGFTRFSVGPIYRLAACGSITAPGTYLLETSLVSQWDCMQVYSDNVILDCQGNSLNGVDGSGYGIVVHHTSPVMGRRVRNIEIRNCKMSLHRYGIFVDASENLYIHDNNTSGNYTDTDKRNFGIFLGLPEGGGIRVNDTHGALISNNHADGMQAIGLDLRSSDGLIVNGNSANGNSAWGIHLYGVTASEVSSNTSTNNIRYCTWGSGVVGAGCDAGGIMLQGGSSNDLVKDNIIAGQNGNGIFIKAHGEPCGDNNAIVNNKIVGALYNAIEMSFCKNNKVQGNEISNSLDGIWMGFANDSEIDAGNYLHDMTNHGIISWNSQNNNVSSNRIVNSREGLYFYSSDYKKEEFYFVSGTPADHVSTENCLCSNTVTNNTAVAFHFNNSFKNQVTGNTLVGNALNFKMEGNTSGNIIEDNNIQGGALDLAPRMEPAALRGVLPGGLKAYDLNGRPLGRAQLARALSAREAGESSSLSWFKTKLRISLGLAPLLNPLQDLASWFAFPL